MHVVSVPDLIDRFLSVWPSLFAAFQNPVHLALALAPALVWLFLFWKKSPERRLVAALVFFGGMVSVLPLLIFKYELLRTETWLQLSVGGGIAAIIVGALWVGLYEEWIKHVVAKKARSAFTCIDDAIEYAIIAALGFSFAENVWYFHNLAQSGNLSAFVVIYRSVASMFLHVFASGIFGYYAGLAFFAKEELQMENAAGRQHTIINKIHSLLHAPSSSIFASAKLFEGVVLASVLHGAFNSLVGIASHTGSNVFLALTVPFLIGGFFWLNVLLDKKEDHITLKQVHNA